MNGVKECSLPDRTRIVHVRLRTADVQKQLTFYTRVLGLKILDTAGADFTLSAAGQESGLLVLTEDRAAPPRPPRSTGLYHFALRFPTRLDLARAYRRLLASDVPIGGAADHAVSEAIYLSDPDGNGIELYADRPCSQWRWQNGQVLMSTETLDLEELLSTIEAEPATAQPSGPDLGHIHLHVADLVAAERFYAEFLGLAVTQRSYPGALFFAAGGYHHHIGVNTWAGKTAPPINSVGLISYRIAVPVPEILYCLNHRAPLMGYEAKPLQADGGPLLEIRDPNGNWAEVQASEVPSSSGGGYTKRAQEHALGHMMVAARL